MILSETRLRNLIRESIDNFILTESQESKSISAAKKLVMQKLGYDEQQADEFVRIKLRGDIPSLRTPQGGKFILGVTRMFCDKELTNASIIGQLNTTLKYVASDAHINEYDRNLNGMSAEGLIDRFASNVETDLENDRNKIKSMQFNGNSDYDIVRIDSFEQASEYSIYTNWCVTHSESMFDSYTNDGINQFYFCLKKGFKYVPRKSSKGCPLDKYGLSMIAISVNENGGLNTCTCRWNHDNDASDNVMTTEEISNVIKMRFYDVFKPNNTWNQLVEDTMQRLANGEDPNDVFDEFRGFEGDFAKVRLNKKFNFIDRNNQLISPNLWFDNVTSFMKEFAMIRLYYKYNFINQNGEILYRPKEPNKWFDDLFPFIDGFALGKINGKYNFLGKNGKLLSNQGFEDAYSFSEGFALVNQNKKWNYINQNGELVSDQWFDDASSKFQGGYVSVKLNGKYNYINRNGQLVSDQWFDDVMGWKRGFLCVILNGVEYYIDENDNLIRKKT